MATLSAAGKGQEGDADDDEGAEYDGDDDAADAEVVLLLHADGDALAVQRAHEAGATGALCDFGGHTGEGPEDTLISLDIAGLRLDCGGGETLERAIASPEGWCRGGNRVSGSHRLLEHAAVSLLQVSHLGEFVASPQCVFGLGDSLGGWASGIRIAGLDVADVGAGDL